MKFNFKLLNKYFIFKYKMLSMIRKNILTILRPCNAAFYVQNTKNFASILSVERMKEKNKKRIEESKAKLNLSSQKIEETIKQSSQFNADLPIKKRMFLNPQAALEELKKIPQKFPNQTLDMVIGLNIDPKRGDQVVRGIYKMPGGSNKIPKLMVFTSPNFVDIAKAAGADMIADATTYKNISEGIIDFEKTVCTLDTLPSLKNLGKILGPKGLMPSTKVGTACTADNLERIIKELKMGSREFKTDMWGQIQVPLGKIDFAQDKILENIDSFMKTVSEKKPESVKARYFIYAILYTYKYSFRIDMRSMDPKSSSYFMIKNEA